MQTNYEALKTLGNQTARLLMQLNDEGLESFTIDDATRILGISRVAASNLLAKAARRGVVNRTKAGHYILVPFELGSEMVYAGNPYLVGNHLLKDRPHFVSHGSAMALHEMTTQPQFVARFSAVNAPRDVVSNGVEYRFVSRKPDDMFGITDAWVTPQRKVPVSDLERTIIDGLREPSYVGGYAEVDKGAWLRRRDIDPGKLVQYALKLNNGAVVRRLGFLMDSLKIGTNTHHHALKDKLTPVYHLLDPVSPKTGPYASRWRLQINVAPEELARARET